MLMQPPPLANAQLNARPYTINGLRTVFPYKLTGVFHAGLTVTYSM